MDRQRMPNLPDRRRDSHGAARNMPGRRSMDQQPPYPPDVRARNQPRNHHGIPSRRPAEHPSLEDGIIELFDSVNDAIQFFSHFEQDFRQDTHRIQTYCEKPLLEEVWASKIRPQASGQRGMRKQHDGDSNFDRPDARIPTFRDTMKELVSSLEGALTAAESYRVSQRRPSRYSLEDAAKIRQQLRRSDHNLRKSFAIVGKRRSEMETVNTELEMLRVFLSRNGAEEGRGGCDPGHSRGGGGRQWRGGDDMRDCGNTEGDTAWEERGEQVEEYSGGYVDGQGEHHPINIGGPTNSL
ncbi:MAG: hypothetical protein Q9208_000620 [Pyrenodesmia sp. 3 TL-2023]